MKLGDLPSNQVTLYCAYFEGEEEHSEFPMLFPQGMKV